MLMQIKHNNRFSFSSENSVPIWNVSVVPSISHDQFSVDLISVFKSTLSDRMLLIEGDKFLFD